MRVALSSDESEVRAFAEHTRRVEVSLSRARARLARRIRALDGDLDRIAGADALSRRAQLFVAEAARAGRGATELTATDWSGGEGVVVTLPLDGARPPKAQVDAIFRRARRLKGGAPIARARRDDASRALERLEALSARLASLAERGADAMPDIEAIARDARSIAPRDFALPEGSVSPARGAKPAGPAAYRAFSSTSGAPIWVGRGAAGNDELTLHVARPHHLWLHARGQAGAHVVVPLAKGKACPAELLVEAAHLAAHFSKARDEAVVEITYVERRHVRKPRGSAPGLVVVARDKTLVLRRSADVVRRLLDRELAG